MENDDVPPLQKVAISGPTLASLLQRISTAHSDINGLLYGHVTHLTTASLSDDHPSSTSTTISTATITSFLSTTAAAATNPNLTLLGAFSGRRKSPLRPSLNEFSLVNSLSNKSKKAEPFLFLLFTTPLENQFIHTHDYRAYQFLRRPGFEKSPNSGKSVDFYFDPISIHVVNIGPAFRGGYGDFIPSSRFPCLDCETRVSPMVEDGKEERSLSELKREKEDQGKLSDLCAEGFGIGELGRLVGSEAVNYTGSLEDLYEKMLAKLEDLARKVEESSAKVLEQENHNIKLRYKVSGLD